MWSSLILYTVYCIMFRRFGRTYFHNICFLSVVAAVTWTKFGHHKKGAIYFSGKSSWSQLTYRHLKPRKTTTIWSVFAPSVRTRCYLYWLRRLSGLLEIRVGENVMNYRVSVVAARIKCKKKKKTLKAFLFPFFCFLCRWTVCCWEETSSVCVCSHTRQLKYKVAITEPKQIRLLFLCLLTCFMFQTMSTHRDETVVGDKGN